MSEIAMGVMPASVTPFSAAGEIDAAGVVRLINWFRSQGCSGVVLAGTNGEGPSLSAVEKRDLVRVAAACSEGLPLILGVATSSLEEAVWSCESARKSGASAALVMPPGYFREASEEGIALWYEALMARSSLPILAYNFPKRSGFALSADLVSRLAKRETFLGLKDSSGNADSLVLYKQAAPSARLYVGDETLLLGALELGWHGSISGAANVVPRWLSQIVSDWSSNQESARTKHSLLLRPLEVLRALPQPMANKALLVKLGVIEEATPRLPLIAISNEKPLSAWQELKGFAY